MLKVGNKVIVKANLTEELKRLDFEEDCIESMKAFIGTKQEVFCLWTDKESCQEYATIDLCVEIPVQCLELR